MISPVRGRRWRAALATAAALVAAAGAFAQTGPAAAVPPGSSETKSIAALRVVTPIDVDGTLDEAPWHEAPAISDLVQTEPSIDQPVSEHTQVRVLVDDEALYFGVVCSDSQPGGVIARELRRDDRLGADDRFEIVLDTFHDHRNSYHFVINPLGTQYDAQITDEGQDVNAEWDERWYAETEITEQGWTAEIAIPLTALRSPRGADTFGVNFLRYIRRNTESASWTGWDRDYSFLQVSQAGHLTGLQGIETGLKLRIKPYALGGFERAGATGDSETQREAGLEVLKFSLTPSLTAEVTLNTDFAQTEVDEAVVNLTRFPTFFPEKREFFLERAGIFEFGLGGRRGGDTERNLQMYFSRRIGLTDDREAVPLIAGAKVIGHAAGLDLGLLDVQTDSFDERPGSNYAVLRAKRNIFSRSNFGAFFSNRQADADDYNRVVGGDLNLTLFKNTDIQGFVARSFTPGREGDSWAGRVKYNWFSDIYELFLEHLYIGPEFQHDVGFVRRSDIRRTNAAFIWEPRPKPLQSFLRNFVFRNEVIYTTDTAGNLLTREQLSRFTSRFQSDDALRFTWSRTLDRLDEPFEISSGIELAPREYVYTEQYVEAEGSGKRLLGGRVRYGWGSFYSGTRRGWRLTPSLRPSSHFSLEATYERNEVKLPEGDFTTDLVNGRINVNLSNRWLTTTLLQYDTESERKVFYFRLNYIYRPGDDLFAVYTRTDDPGRDPDHSLLVKLTYSFDLR